MPFYDLLGGLADNLLTIGNHAGSFLSCHTCGHTFSTKDESWSCQACGEFFELKFTPAKFPGSPFETTVRVSGLSKPRMNPHWYFDNENWAVAEFLTQILRLTPELFLRPWLETIGVHLGPGDLETILCWPRFTFGGKTIQPDFVIGFAQDIVLFEFKRPSGGKVPSVELAGQVCFGAYAGSKLGRRWHLVVVPGGTCTTQQRDGFVKSTVGGFDEAYSKWKVPIDRPNIDEMADESKIDSRLIAIGWRQLIQDSITAIMANYQAGWSRQQAILKLEYWLKSREELGLLKIADEAAPVSDEAV